MTLTTEVPGRSANYPRRDTEPIGGPMLPYRTSPFPPCAHPKKAESKLCYACEMKRRQISREDRLILFWRHVDRSGSCWLWTAYRNETGYGIFKDRGRHVRAHRWIYGVLNGPVPADMHVEHLCNTPPCVRPEHLRMATAKENNARIRTGAGATHCKRGHPFDATNTYIEKSGARNCRVCARLRRRRLAEEAE